MKKYLRLKPNAQKNTDLKVKLYYSLGGMNYFSARAEGRGYYLSVVPVERGEMFERFTGFTGIKKLILEVKRQSPKAEKQAEDLCALSEQELIDHVLAEQGLELEEVV